MYESKGNPIKRFVQEYLQFRAAAIIAHCPPIIGDEGARYASFE